MAHSRQNSDDESGARLLDQDDEVLVSLQRAHPPHLHLAQRMVGGLISFADPTAAVSVGMAMANAASIDVPVAVKYVTTMVAWVSLKEGMDGMNALSRQENPLRRLRAMGGGNFVRGFGKDALKKTIVAAPIAGLWVGLAYGQNALFEWAIQDAVNHQMLVLAMVYLDGPTLRTLMVALVTLPLYKLGLKIANICVPEPHFPAEVNPQTRWYQDVMKGGTRILYGVVAGEFVRETCNTVIGFALVFHNRYSLMIAPLCELFFREPAYYYASVIKPFAKLDLSCTAPAASEMDEEEVDDEASVLPTPSKCRQIVGLSTRLAIVCVIFTAATVANNYIVKSMGGANDESRDDPAAWSYAGRMGYESLLVGGCVFAYGAVMLVPETVQRVGRWCCGLFGRRQQPDQGVDQVELGHVSRLA